MSKFNINSDELRREITELPGHYASTVEALAQAKVVRADAEQKFKILRLALENEIRTFYRNSGDKKPTEDAIKIEVLTDKKVAAAQEALHEADKHVTLLEATRDAYSVKRDMLVSLAALQRAELETLKLSGVR